MGNGKEGNLLRVGPKLSAALCKPPGQCSLVPLKGLVGHTFTWEFLSKHLNDFAQEWATARVGHLLRVQ